MNDKVMNDKVMNDKGMNDKVMNDEWFSHNDYVYTCMSEIYVFICIINI